MCTNKRVMFNNSYIKVVLETPGKICLETTDYLNYQEVFNVRKYFPVNQSFACDKFRLYFVT